MDIKQLKQVVRELKGASRMHAAQARKVEAHIKKMQKASKKK